MYSSSTAQRMTAAAACTQQHCWRWSRKDDTEAGGHDQCAACRRLAASLLLVRVEVGEGVATRSTTSALLASSETVGLAAADPAVLPTTTTPLLPAAALLAGTLPPAAALLATAVLLLLRALHISLIVRCFLAAVTATSTSEGPACTPASAVSRPRLTPVIVATASTAAAAASATARGAGLQAAGSHTSAVMSQAAMVAAAASSSAPVVVAAAGSAAGRCGVGCLKISITPGTILENTYAWKLRPLPDILTGKLAMSSSGPNPRSPIMRAGSSPRMARCTTATALSVREASNRRPNAALPECGTPSQNEYACVAGSRLPTFSTLLHVMCGRGRSASQPPRRASSSTACLTNASALATLTWSSSMPNARLMPGSTRLCSSGLPRPAPMSTSVLLLSRWQLWRMELKIFCMPVRVMLP
mmetsp:Transcript_553/g.1506  ORF Transcript_553/g.1506 Transcript_553/m.1506 type:complete len:416 (-) Transcript_553:294-1541(-)